MPRHINPPKSINDWGGLKPYLDATADKHNGLKHRDFLQRIRPRKHPISKAAAAEDFNVSTKTWYDWLKRHEQEQVETAQKQPQPPTGPGYADSSD